MTHDFATASRRLTERQLKAVELERDMFLAACPGSGKTRTAATRVGRLIRSDVAVAACSYTNVGVTAIRDVITKELGIVPNSRHFIGTLHRFLLRYVTYPFGHLLFNGPTLRLVQDESALWPVVLVDGDARKRISIASFRMRPDRSMRMQNLPVTIGASPEQVLETCADEARAQKIRMLRRGLVSFDDAMYVALRVLQGHPTIAASVARRFAELLIDEAQDTSELQLACVREIADSGGLDSLTLVGDIEQSISAYTGASAEGCEALATHRGLTRIDLVENHRSSQKICNVAVHFCSRATPDVAVGPDASHPVKPELLVYDAKDPRTVLPRFESRLAKLGEDLRDAAVLARSNKLCDEINGVALAVDIAPRPLSLGRAVAAVRGSGTLSRSDIELVERLLCFAAHGHEDVSSLKDRRELRSGVMCLLSAAPELDTDLRAWIRAASGTLDQVTATLVATPAKTGGQVLRSAAGQEGHVARQFFTPQPATLSAQTVHDIKGESRGATLVVIDKTRGRARGQSSLWAQPLLGEAVAPEDAEELRIAYVALTRARRYSAVAIPNDCPEDIIGAFEAVGFRLRNS